MGAEDIKAYFEKLRGDAEAIKAAGGAAEAAGDDTNGEGDNRREQHGKPSRHSPLGVCHANCGRLLGQNPRRR